MTKTPPSFEERLARLEQKSGTPRPVPTPPPPQSLQRPRGNGSRTLSIMLICAVGFLVVSAVAFVAAFKSERLLVAMVEWTTDAEIAGKETALARVMSGDESNDAIRAQAMDVMQAKINSGELTGENAARAKSFIQSNTGKSSAEIMRGHVRPMLMMKAESAGQPQMARAVAAKLDACKTTDCIAMVQARFNNELHAATGGN